MKKKEEEEERAVLTHINLYANRFNRTQTHAYAYTHHVHTWSKTSGNNNTLLRAQWCQCEKKYCSMLLHILTGYTVSLWIAWEWTRQRWASERATEKSRKTHYYCTHTHRTVRHINENNTEIDNVYVRFIHSGTTRYYTSMYGYNATVFEESRKE